MAGLSTVTIPAPTLGVNVASAPSAMKKNEAQVLDNFIIRDPGKAEMRGPLNGRLDITGAAAIPTGLWTNNIFLMAESSATAYQINTTSMTKVSTALPGTFLAMHYQYAQIGDNVWGKILSNLAAGIVLMKWTTTPAYTLLANGPSNFTDVVEFQNRLVVLAGSPPGGGTFNRYALYWSDRLGPITDTLAEWQDDTSGLVNQLTYASSDTPVALAKCGQSLAICMSDSMYLLSGSSPSNWTSRLISSSFGCVNPQTIVESADGFYFLSNQGFCFTDGVRFTIVSEAVQPYINKAMDSETRATLMSNGFIAITSRTDTFPTLLYNPANQTWTTFSCTAFTNHSLFGADAAARASTNTVFHDGRYMWQANAVTFPESVIASRRGRDYTGAANIDIIPTWKSLPLDLAGPTERVQINYMALDYRFRKGSAGTPPPGWYLSLLEPNTGTTIFPAWDVGAVSSTDTAPRRRKTIEAHIEADDIQASVTWPGNATISDVDIAEIHDLHIVYQVTNRQVR